MLNCINALLVRAKGKIKRREAEEIVSEVEKRFRRPLPEKIKPGDQFDAQGNKSPEQLIFEFADQAFQEAVKQKEEAVRRREMQVDAQARLQHQIATSGGGRVKGLVDIMVGRADGKFEGLAVQGRVKALTNEYLARIYEGLDHFLTAFGHKITPEQELEVARAIMDPRLLEKVSLDKSGASPAELLAAKFRWVENAVYHRKNAAGANIQYLPGHLPQSWDPSKVRFFGLSRLEQLEFLKPGLSEERRGQLRTKVRDAWVKHVTPLLDQGRYVDETNGLPLDDRQIQKMLEDVWLTLATNGLVKNEGGVVGGEPSLAERLGAHRELHFKDAESFLEANRAYGTRDIFTAITGTVQRHATEIAMLETFGPNPDAGFKSALAFAQAQQAEKTLFGREGSRSAELIFDELKGVYNSASEEKFDMISSFFQGTRNMITSAKMGMLLLSQVNDIATFRALVQSDGLDTGKALRLSLSMLNPANAQDRKTARLHGILTQSVLHDVAQRYGQTVQGTGLTSRAANWTVTLSGAEHWTNSLKQAYQVLVGYHLADALKLDFANLADYDPRFAEMVRRYGITDADWQVLRQADTVEIAGHKILTPLTVGRTITDDMMRFDLSGRKAAEIGRAAEMQVRDLAEKVGAMMAEEADIAMLTPGLKEHAIVKQGTSPGTIMGEATRSFFLFKTFTVSILTKALPRIFAAGPAGGMSRGNIAAQWALGMIIGGAISMQLKEVAKGRDPRDMMTPEFWGAATVQSGGLGIFGDFFFADYSRFGGTLGAAAIGPVGGLIEDFMKLTVGNIQQAAQGKDAKFGAEAIQFAKNYAPLMNLWYTRQALDHLLFYQIQEAVNPGYLRRMKDRVRRENDQTFWWSPNEPLPQGPPDLGKAIGQ